MALLVFLELNKYWLSASPLDLYHLAVRVSKSKASGKSYQLTRITKFIEDHLTQLPK